MDDIRPVAFGTAGQNLPNLDDQNIGYIVVHTCVGKDNTCVALFSGAGLEDQTFGRAPIIGKSAVSVFVTTAHKPIDTVTSWCVVFYPAVGLAAAVLIEKMWYIHNCIHHGASFPLSLLPLAL